MEAINSQREIANEISEAISNPVGAGIDIDEVRNVLPFEKQSIPISDLQSLYRRMSSSRSWLTSNQKSSTTV